MTIQVRVCVCVCVCLCLCAIGRGCVGVSVSLHIWRCSLSILNTSCVAFVPHERDSEIILAHAQQFLLFAQLCLRWLLAVVLQSTLEVVVLEVVFPTVCQSTLERHLGESDRMLGRAL